MAMHPTVGTPTVTPELRSDLWDCVSLTVDVDWAADEVVADVRQELDARGIRATFFCTHPGIDVPGHERALHPNFRRQGDTVLELARLAGPVFADWPESELYQGVVQKTLEFCPEAVGVRGHSLFYDSLLLEVYHQAGLVYDSTYLLPLTHHLGPILKEYNILELPIYYNDQFDMKTQATGFQVNALQLDRPGMKIFNFHPNTIHINANSHHHYLETKAFYKDVKRLKQVRATGRGVGTLFLELLDHIASRGLRTATLREINDLWRKHQPGQDQRGPFSAMVFQEKTLR